MGKGKKGKQGKRKKDKRRQQDERPKKDAARGPGPGTDERAGARVDPGAWPALELVEEVELAALLGDELPGGGEASGVYHLDGQLYVVFDDAPHVARIASGGWSARGKRRKGSAGATLFRQRGAGGFEDLTFDPRERRWYLLVESAAQKGVWRPRVEEYSEDLRFLRAGWLDWEVEDENKGLEGLAFLRLGGRDCILGLCEGNYGRGGRRGREPGHGRLQLFARGKRDWEHVRELELPPEAAFEDYASLDVRGQAITVASQSSSAVWLGRIEGLEGRGTFLHEGVLAFPRDRKGRPRYGSVEGVAWVAQDELVAVSDQHETSSPGLHRAVHRFRIPRP